MARLRSILKALRCPLSKWSLSAFNVATFLILSLFEIICMAQYCDQHQLALFCLSVCWLTKSILTRESDVKSLVGNGEVREKADLSRVVSKQSCTERWRQCGARQSPQRLREAAILCHQQEVVRALKVEGVEGELDTWIREEKRSIDKNGLFILYFYFWPLHK